MSEVALAQDDVAIARGLIKEIAGHCWGGKGDMVDRVYDAIDDHFRRQRRRHSWTRRRVRSFWHLEAAGVRFHEMIELAAVAVAAHANRDRLEEARKDHAEFVTRAARMATALAVQDQEFHRDAIDAFSRIAGAKDDLEIGRASRRCHEASAANDRAGRAVGAGGCL